MKICRRCGILKSLDDYYKHSQMSDNHLNICKSCNILDAKERYNFLRHDIAWIEKERARGRDKYKRLYRYYKKDPELAQKARIKWGLKYPEKIQATKKVANLVRKGLLPRIKDRYYHHWSYSVVYQSDVISLTIEHHFILHRYLQYDQCLKLFKTKDSILLNNKMDHIKYLKHILNDKDRRDP